MTPLARELAELAPAIDWPEEPDVSAVVAARIAERPPRSTVPRRLGLVLALLLAGALAVLAVPPARTAILDWLGIGAARIVHVEELPSLDPAPGLEILGERVSLEDARAGAGFRFSLPPGDEPAPDEVLLAPGIRVTYLWREGRRVRLMITQFRGSVDDPAVLKKVVGSSTGVEQLEVDGRAAVWLEGGPHVVFVVGPDGDVRDDRGWLAGNTLLVDRGDVTVRVEGALERDEAVELVQALRP